MEVGFIFFKVALLLCLHTLSVSTIACDEVVGSEPLYSKIQKVFVKINTSEEIQKEVRLTVDLSPSLSKVSKQILHIQLTDDEDPYFLYTLLITEEDYQQLKLSQGLLVDFHNFPGQVVRLFEQCNNDNVQGQRFLLFLEEEKKSEKWSDAGTTYLKVVETNNFKHLCHLVLRIEIGNDNDIKKLMLKKIKLLKEKIIRDEKCMKQMESQLSTQSKLLESKQHELQQIQHSWQEDKIAFKTESSKELTEETEKLKRTQLEWKIRTERELMEIEEKYQGNMKEKEAEVSKLRIENQILMEKHVHSESLAKEQTKRIESLEKDFASAKWELGTLRKQSARLDADYHDKEKNLNSLRTKLAVAEQELKDKSVLMNKQQELLGAASEQKARLEETLGEKEKQLQKKQTSLQSVTDELVKANEIITKLQKELGVVSTKLKVRTEIALEQEKVVESSRKKISELEQKILSREKKIKTRDESESQLKKTIEDLNQTIENKEKTINDNERVISWLNKRINDQYKEVGTKWSPTINGNISPTTSTPFGLPPAIIPGRVQYGMHTDVGTSIDRLGQVQTTLEREMNKLTNTESIPVGDNSKASEHSNKNPSPSIKPSESSKQSAKSVGFKRVKAVPQTTTVPSSYFLK